MFNAVYLCTGEMLAFNTVDERLTDEHLKNCSMVASINYLQDVFLPKYYSPEYQKSELFQFATLENVERFFDHYSIRRVDGRNVNHTDKIMVMMVAFGCYTVSETEAVRLYARDNKILNFNTLYTVLFQSKDKIATFWERCTTCLMLDKKIEDRAEEIKMGRPLGDAAAPSPAGAVSVGVAGAAGAAGAAAGES